MEHMEARGLWKLFVVAAMRWPARRISHSHLFVLFRAGTFASILATLLPRPWRPQALQSSFVAAMRGRGPKSMLMSQTSVAAAFQCTV